MTTTPVREATQPEATPRAPQRETRPEIQALRAIAVLGVVTYHLWPQFIRGGYVGVDIFFVISGFLITSHLLREVVRTGRIKLASFWARRARRLLPASLLVIVASFVGMLLFAPTALWAQFDSEFAASATYVQNWVLAANSVDYLAADNAASPVQHFWTLSVEEQFYLAWPLLILLAIGLATLVRRVSRMRLIAIVLSVVTVASFAYCVFLTATDSAPAYFVTPTRAWEFGLGGLLALATARARTLPGPRIRGILSWIGLVTLAGTILLFTPALSFPGWIAIIPTAATALVIFAGAPDSRFAPTVLLRLRPVQWLGDVSYSFYLWHWPPIVLLPFLLSTTDLGSKAHVGIFFGSLLLAWLTKRFVEDPVRRTPWLTRRTPYLTLAITAVFMVLIVAMTTITTNVQNSATAAAVAKSRVLTRPGTSCLGAAAFDPAHQPCVDHKLDGQLLPDAAAAELDWVVPPNMHCRSGVFQAGVSFCDFPYGTKKRVALIGDSHAEQWLPAMRNIAEKQGWTLDTFLKGGCPFSAVARIDNKDTSHGSCTVWNRLVMARLAAHPYDLVVTSQVTGTTFATSAGETSQQAGTRGLVERWNQLQASGTRVVALRDDPVMPGNVPDCLSALRGEAAAKAATCGGVESTAIRPDPQVEAAKESGAGLVDLTPFFCEKGVCPAVIGSVVVYRDDAHMGGLFSRTLSPYLYAQLAPLLTDWQKNIPQPQSSSSGG